MNQTIDRKWLITSMLISSFMLLALSAVDVFGEESDYYYEHTEQYVMSDIWYDCSNGTSANFFIMAYYNGTTVVSITQFNSNYELSEYYYDILDDEQLKYVVNYISETREFYEGC